MNERNMVEVLVWRSELLVVFVCGHLVEAARFGSLKCQFSRSPLEV